MTRICANYIAPFSIVLALVGFPVHDAAADTFVVYGASDNVGGAIVEEALSRGHDVIGVSRDPANLTNEHPSFSAVLSGASELCDEIEQRD